MLGQIAKALKSKLSLVHILPRTLEENGMGQTGWEISSLAIVALRGSSIFRELRNTDTSHFAQIGYSLQYFQGTVLL